MESTRGAWLAVAAAAVVAAGAWGAGCYNPAIESNKLSCAPTGKACPDGFQCSAGKCVKLGAVGPGSGGSTGSGGAGTGGSAGNGSSGGAPGTGGAPLRAVFESCQIKNAGTADQSHDCSAGLECLQDCAGGVPHCYRACTADTECPASSCTRTFAGVAGQFCEPDFTDCNPVANSTCAINMNCKLLSSQPAPGGGDRTVCECQTGTAARGEPCSSTRQCFPGLVCPPGGSGPGAEVCQRPCDPMAGAAACTAGTCRPFGARWGYCS